MHKQYGCECVESRGSHGVADLICGNGKTVFVIQVKGGLSLPYISWEELEKFAEYFKGVPLFLYKPDYRLMRECHNESDLERLRHYLKELRRKRDN